MNHIALRVAEIRDIAPLTAIAVANNTVVPLPNERVRDEVTEDDLLTGYAEVRS